MSADEVYNAIDLSNPAASFDGFKIIGENGGDFAGNSVSSAGDINSDGVPDLLVGAQYNDEGGVDAGTAYVVFGKADIAAVNLDDVAKGVGGFKIIGENEGDNAGASVSSVGDINNDGIPDLLVGAPENDAGGRVSAGAAYVVFGKGDTANVNLDDVALGVGGFKVIGEYYGDRAGNSVSSAGDINDDGIPDLLVGARLNDAGGKDAGAAYVVFGKTDTTAVNLNDVAVGNGGFKIVGEGDYNYVGQRLSSAGDINNDGIPDLLIAPQYDDQGGYRAGAAYVMFGKADTAMVNLDYVAAGIGGFKIIGENVGDHAGFSVSSTGDVNRDGIPDLLVGAISNDEGGVSAGAAYVVMGKSDTEIVYLDDVALGIGGFKIIGEDSEDAAGWSVSSAGDINNDGIPDLLIGTGYNEQGPDGAGAAFVVFGKAESTTVNLDDVAAGIGGFEIIGEDAGDLFGRSVSSAGDVNGDGIPDLLVGAINNGEGGSQAGAAYVVFGPQPVSGNIIGTSGNDRLEGTAGNDAMDGLGGNDTLVSSTGDDVMDGGDGNGDWAWLHGNFADFDITFDGATGTFDYVGSGGLFDVGTNELSNIEYVAFLDTWFPMQTLIDQFGHVIEGTNGDDKLYGTAENDAMDGLCGNDTLVSSSGDDVMDGGAGDADWAWLHAPFADFDISFDGGTGTFDYVGTGGLFDVGANELRNIEYVAFLDTWFPMQTLIDQFGHVIEGTNGDDKLYGTAENDAMDGLCGNDTLVSSTGDDVMDGGAGDGDWAWLHAPFADFDISFDGGTGTFDYVGTGGLFDVGANELRNIEYVAFLDTWFPMQTLIDQFGDVIEGTNGDDKLYGTADNDVMDGLCGNDTLVSSTGDDVMDGGAGDGDWAWLHAPFADFGISFDGGTGTFDYVGSNGLFDVGANELRNIEYVAFLDTWFPMQTLMDSCLGTDWVGTDGDDIHDGTDCDDTLDGRGGNDSLNGLAGNDILDGGAGSDTLDGGVGDDVVTDQEELILDYEDYTPVERNNALYGGEGNDTLSAEEVVEAEKVEEFSTVMDGGSGNDLLSATARATAGSGGFATIDLKGGDGNDELLAALSVIGGSGGSATNDLKGGAGDDTVTATAGSGGVGNWKSTNIIDSGGGNDLITADAKGGGAGGTNDITGGDGNDTIIARANGGDMGSPGIAGNVIDGGGGADWITAVATSSGFDSAFASNTVHGGDGNDTIEATAEPVSIFGGEAANELFGGNGDDVLTALSTFGLGEINTLFGDAGNDTLTVISDGVASIFREDHHVLDGGAGNDSLTISDADGVLDGGVGDDILQGGSGEDTLDGGAGNDTLDGGGGADTMVFALGYEQDTVTGFVRGEDVLKLNSDLGIIRFADLDSNASGGLDDGDSLVSIIGGATKIDFGAGDEISIDVIGLTANDFQLTLEGGASDDLLQGDDARNEIFGFAGNDTLDGSTGNDTLDGGEGDDRIVFAQGYGQDAVSGFTQGEDILELNKNLGVDEFADLDRSPIYGEGNPYAAYREVIGTEIDFGGGDVLSVYPTAPGQLTNDDFDFVT